MESYESADFDPLDMKPGLKASELTDKGIEFVYKGMREDEGKFGKFYAIQAEIDGEDEEILFSSKRLAALFTKHGDAFMDKELNLAGYDEGVNRKYKVTVVQTTL